jgi:hypothetical protein
MKKLSPKLVKAFAGSISVVALLTLVIALGAPVKGLGR